MSINRTKAEDYSQKITDYGFTGVSGEYARRHHSIRGVKGLQILKCNGLSKLTDFTLTDAFELQELKEVYFSRCNVSILILPVVNLNHCFLFFKFTIKGVTALVNNCPSLEVLDLSECKEIDDDCLNVITSTLTRLKTLKLNRCDKITEKSLTILYENCSELRVSLI